MLPKMLTMPVATCVDRAISRTKHYNPIGDCDWSPNRAPRSITPDNVAILPVERQKPSTQRAQVNSSTGQGRLSVELVGILIHPNRMAVRFIEGVCATV